jgi:hypothetical protein
MKPGQKVTVWADPITQIEFEGFAILEELIDRDEVDGRERWMVRFVDDNYKCERIFYPPANK